MLGHSGASVYLLRDERDRPYASKHGPGVREQLDYLMLLPPETRPAVYEVFKDGYAMQALEHPPLRTQQQVSDLLQKTHDVLRDFYWFQPTCVRMNDRWDVHLIQWLHGTCPHHASETVQLLRRVYSPGLQVVARPCLIHGDPTLANVMVDATGRLRLIDPIKPMGKVPSFCEVDMGKLLQSAMGWEHTLAPDRCVQPWPRHQYEVLAGYDQVIKARAWFWCAVHALRVLPYAKSETVREWAATTWREAHTCASALI